MAVILIVEDDDSMRELMMANLESKLTLLERITAKRLWKLLKSGMLI